MGIDAAPKNNGNGRLTGLQQAFVIEYMKDFNATRAAQRAGYNGGYSTCAMMGCENLKKPKIMAAISERLEQRAMGKEEVAHRLAMIARSSLEDVLTFQDGGVWAIDIPGAHEEGNLYAVKGLENTQYGLRVRMEEKLRALELLGKAHGMFVDRQEITGKDQGPIETKDVGFTDEDRATALAQLFDRVRAANNRNPAPRADQSAD